MTGFVPFVFSCLEQEGMKGTKDGDDGVRNEECRRIVSHADVGGRRWPLVAGR